MTGSPLQARGRSHANPPSRACACSTALSALDDDGLQVLARDHERSLAARAVAARQELDQRHMQFRLTFRRQRRERFVRRSIVRTKDLDEMLGGPVPENEIASRGPDAGC